MNKQLNRPAFLEKNHSRYDYPLQRNRKTHYEVYQAPTRDPEAQQPQDRIKNDTLKVMEAHEYSKLESVLSGRLKNLLENISVCREKNQLKDREVQSNLAQIDKLDSKIKKLEQRTAMKEKMLHKVSIRCKEINDSIAGEEEKVKKEMVYQHEEAKQCEKLEEQIFEMEKEIRLAQNELERRQKLTENLQEKQQEQEKLRQLLTKLVSNEKMIEYQAHNEKNECIQLEKKAENLKKVLKDRTAINKSNAAKLAKLSKEVQSLQIFIKNRQSSANEVKNMELEVGELNQELLLINEDISELNFKILRKRQTIAQLKAKSEASRMQMSTLTNQTPTFPSKQLLSEQPAKMEGEQPPNATEALKNIEKLINRYQRIKGKQEQRY